MKVVRVQEFPWAVSFVTQEGVLTIRDPEDEARVLLTWPIPPGATCHHPLFQPGVKFVWEEEREE